MQKALKRLTQTIALAFALVLSASVASAQVTVSMADVTGRQGEAVTVPVTITGATVGTPVNSFGFTVTTPAGITFTGATNAGTLSAGQTVSSNATTGVVGGFGSGITTDGALVNLNFTYDNPFTGTGSVSLASTQINGGAVVVTPATPAFTFVASNRLMSVGSQTARVGDSFEVTVSFDDALVAGDNVNAYNFDLSYDPAVMTIDKTKGSGGVITTGTLTDGQTVNLNDVGGLNSGLLRVGGFGSTVTGAGAFVKIAFTAAGAGSSTSTLSNVALQSGNPVYALVAGTTTVVVNSAPVASAGTLTAVEDGSGTTTLVATDANGDALTYTAGNGTNGTVTVAGAVATYTPNADFSGTDSFTFTANDGQTDSAAGTITVTVTAVNDAPVSSAGTLTTNEDTAGTVTLAATDVDGDALTYTASNGTSGTVTVAGAVATYTPNANFNGTDSFTFTVNDGTVDSNSSTVTVTVSAVNDAPVAAAATLTTDEDTAGTVTLSATDADGDALTYTATQPANGSVTVAGAVATYTPNANYNGADSFTFTANDGTVDSASATVSVTVTAVNDAPTVAASAISTLENASIAETLTGSDIDGDALTFSVTQPTNGTVTLVGAVATYTPNAGFNGTDTFTYTANDGTVDSASATITVTVAMVNDAPVAAGIGAVTDEDNAVAVTFTATDADGDAVTFALGTQPTNGTVVVAGTTATYTPNANYNGTDSFTYTANDGTVDSAPATVTVTINAVNDAPVATAATGSTAEDTAVDVALVATDVDGDALTYTAGAASNGTVAISGATATYTPNANFNGTDTFTYVANDGTVDSAPATVTVTVGAVNDVPVVADATMAVDEDGSGELTLTATDGDGDAITFAIGAATNGTAALDGDKVTYTPDANYNGTDSFTYTANDGTVDSAPATVTVTVAAVNDAPVFTAEMAGMMVAEDNGTITFTYAATDVDGDALTYSMVGAPAAATLDAATGAFSFDPSMNAGTYSIVVSVTDGTATVAAATAELVVYTVDSIYSPLAGVHEVSPVSSPGSGWVNVRLVEGSNTLEVSGSFTGLGSNYAASHIHLGGVGENGGVGVALTAVASADMRSGTWSVADNTFDLSALTDGAALAAALKSGGAYVNVHSAAHASGELRGQLLSPMNAAPAAATVRAPSSATITGDPANGLFSISWLPVSDPDGDAINYILEIASDAAFTDLAMFENMGVTNGFSLTVGDAAELYDIVTDATPGAVNVGGAASVFMRVTTTDGSLWTVGATSELVLTRGVVTDIEDDSELPSEFALQGNYPNPFNPSTTIRFDLPQTADISVTVVDLVGREVMFVPTATFDAGSNRSIQIDAASLSSGIYMYRVVAQMQDGLQIKVGSMTLIK